MTRPEILYRRLFLLLKYGSFAAVSVIGIGLVWFGLAGNGSHFVTEEFAEPGNVRLALQMLNLGIAILMLLPIGGVLICLTYFTNQRERRASLISLGVLLVLILGIFLGLLKV